MSTAVIEDARTMARHLVNREAKGPGDTENAMRRIEARYGVSFSTLWGLRYRAPKDMMASAYFRLQAAYQAECERQMRQIEHELEITKAKAGAASALVRAASALAGKETT